MIGLKGGEVSVFDALDSMSFEGLDNSVQFVHGGTEHLGGHVVRDPGPVSGEDLVLRVPFKEQEERRLEIHLSPVLHRHRDVLSLPNFVGLVFFHLDNTMICDVNGPLFILPLIHEYYGLRLFMNL